MTMESTQKVCRNGHRMEPEWEVCPYCPSNRPENPALARTVKVDHTRPAPPPPASRKTEILHRESAPAGVGWLVESTGPRRGRSHRVDGSKVVLGASPDCDVHLEGGHVSDRHASLRFQDGAFRITDLDSTNGTSVNGVRVQQERLEDGDRLALGAREWVFKCVVFDDQE